MQTKQLQTQLHLWPSLQGGKATLINLSENHTFLIDTPNGEKHIIRVHRPLYQSLAAIKSELLWLQALKNDTDLPLITPLEGVDGELVQQVALGNSQTSYAVRFAFEKGCEGDSANLDELFADLGRFAAICHKHVERWQKPSGFSRPTWDLNTILEKNGLWGNWRKAPKVKGEILEILEKAEVKARHKLLAYGKEKHRFGLIHADMRFANVLVDNGKSRLIDFDDCGFGWFAYDFAASVSFFEHDEIVPKLKQIWLKAYREVRPFSQEDGDIIDTTVFLRRMALLAWIESHKETKLAQSHAGDFAINSAQLAESFLLKN